MKGGNDYSRNNHGGFLRDVVGDDDGDDDDCSPTRPPSQPAGQLFFYFTFITQTVTCSLILW